MNTMKCNGYADMMMRGSWLMAMLNLPWLISLNCRVEVENCILPILSASSFFSIFFSKHGERRHFRDQSSSFRTKFLQEEHFTAQKKLLAGVAMVGSF